MDKKTINEILEIMQAQVAPKLEDAPEDGYDIKACLLEEYSNKSTYEDFNYEASRKGFFDGTDFEYVAQEGGEGEGDYYGVTYKYVPTEQYFGPVGWYASYEGHSLEDIKLQEPITQVVYR